MRARLSVLVLIVLATLVPATAQAQQPCTLTFSEVPPPAGEWSIGFDLVSATDAWALTASRSGAEGEPPLHHLSRWNGATWSEVDLAPELQGTVYIQGMAATATKVWLVGLWNFAEPADMALIAVYDRAADVWTLEQIDTDFGGEVTWLSLLSVSQGWVTGTVSAEFADGGRSGVFVQHRTPSGWELELVEWSAPSPAVVEPPWAFLNGQALRFNGDWQPHPLSGIVTAAWSLGTNNVWAGGDGFVSRWDGASWSPLWAPEGDVAAIAGLSSRDVWALGTTAGHFDGEQWTDEPTAVRWTWADSAGNEVWRSGVRGVEPVLQRLCPVRVSDTGFNRPTSTARLGAVATWLFPRQNTKKHSLADDFGLIAASNVPPGGSADELVIVAGTYKVRDSVTGRAMTMPVAPTVASAVAVGKSTRLTWATAQAPSGLVYDVQWRRPGTTTWSGWRWGTAAKYAAFTPASAGDYLFRSRARNTSTGKTLGWSPPIMVTAS